LVNIDKIKSLAKEKGISITFLCQTIGQGPYYLNDVKKRNGSIPEDRLQKIAEILGTTADYLADKTEQKERPAQKEKFLEIPADPEELTKLLREKTEAELALLIEVAKDILQKS